jgi:hypothetical protein
MHTGIRAVIASAASICGSVLSATVICCQRAFRCTYDSGIRHTFRRRALLTRFFRQDCLINLPPTKSNPGKHLFLLPDLSGNFWRKQLLHPIHAAKRQGLSQT